MRFASILVAIFFLCAWALAMDSDYKQAYPKQGTSLCTDTTVVKGADRYELKVTDCGDN